jgi:cytochrome P450
MEPIVFLQSDVKDPYSLYEDRLRQSSIHKDPDKALWGIYGYEDCKTLLSHPSTAIPALNPGNKDGLNEYAWLLQDHFVRISNPPRHEVARWTGIHLMTQMTRPSIPGILEDLMQRSGKHGKINWVEQVGKMLPVAVMLKSFEFNARDSEYIAENMASLTKIMSPEKTKGQVAEINMIAAALFPIVRRHILETPPYLNMVEALSRGYDLDNDTAMQYVVSNLIGLFIQGYDACRGLLSNALLSVLREDGTQRLQSGLTDKKNMGKWVMETLRFDPPVHNTRRIVTGDISLRHKEIKKGDVLFIILAAANRDTRKFERPRLFNIERSNNDQHMTLGSGPHSCLAKYFAVQLTTETLACLFEKYRTVTLVDPDMDYESLVNIRMPKKIIIDLK